MKPITSKGRGAKKGLVLMAAAVFLLSLAVFWPQGRSQTRGEAKGAENLLGAELSSSFLLTTPGWMYESDHAGWKLGIGTHRAGDLNGDGYDDAAVSVNHYENGESFEGASFVF
ncbi:MAG TPA: FG-GAP repeat protein, partial [Candidatus Krumholzibacteriaceae bacterium]|nr:FG-GAP repeat protein [Candidatus Krumholzibacteriaceae bacterium]